MLYVLRSARLQDCEQVALRDACSATGEAGGQAAGRCGDTLGGTRHKAGLPLMTESQYGRRASAAPGLTCSLAHISKVDVCFRQGAILQ